MPNINDAFPSNYLKASDIKGREPVVAIDHVSMEEVGRQKDRKAVLYFIGKEKGLILNKTNANKIIQLTGSPVTEEWQGFRVKLYATETEFGGETVECIRIKAAPPQAAQRQAPPPPPPPPVDVHTEPVHEDEIPF